MKPLPPVYPFPIVQDWLKHMDKQAMRKMPLVLDADTKMFKTIAGKIFCVDAKNYIELNCCNLVHEDNLRGVNSGTEVINSDEDATGSYGVSVVLG